MTEKIKQRMQAESKLAQSPENPPSESQAMKTIGTSELRKGLAFLLVFLLLAAGSVTAVWFYYRNFAKIMTGARVS